MDMSSLVWIHLPDASCIVGIQRDSQILGLEQDSDEQESLFSGFLSPCTKIRQRMLKTREPD